MLQQYPKSVVDFTDERNALRFDEFDEMNSYVQVLDSD